VKRRVTFVIIIVIALIIWGLQSYKEEQEIVASDKTNPHFVDVFMRNFTLTATDEKGAPDYTLQASYFEHFNDETNSLITEPVVHFLQDNNRWIITAKNGELDNDNHLIILHDNVVVLQQDTDAPIQITTSQLEINTEQKIATSNKKVNITHNELKLQSNGMILNNNTGELELLAKVKGHYVQAD
jgi:LPS export ABC transporter protein LptC